MSGTGFASAADVRLGWRNALALLLGYLVLESASYIHPLYGLNITPWNPAPALGLVFFLRFGRNAAPTLILAIVAADVLVRATPLSLYISVGLSMQLALGYWAIAEVLRRRLAGGGIFTDQRGLIEWFGIVFVGTLLNSLIFVSVLTLGYLIPADAWQQAFIRYWVGDAVGILVSMPILWMLVNESGRAQLRATISGWEPLGYLAGTGIALWVAFDVGAEADFRYFYVLLLPIAWAAARQGLAGAVLDATVVQLGIIGTFQLLRVSAVTVIEIQILAVVLALFGFSIGIIVDEKQRVSAELRQTLRLAAAGEMAGALAHELNQPLTALSVYATACEQLLEQDVGRERLRETLRRIVVESSRAADVARRLREFFRTGATRLERVALKDLIASAVSRFLAKAKQRGIEVTVDPAPDCTILADRLQLEIVLRNLLSTAFDASAEMPPGQRRIRLSAHMLGADRVSVSVEDSGPGLSDWKAAHLVEALQSSKESGLGLGLAISRAIVEAHGGSLWAEVANHGKLKFLLPIEEKTTDAN